MNTANNPADMASRGLKVITILKEEKWMFGPQFLLQPPEEWPQNPDGLKEISSKDSEVKIVTVNAAHTMPEDVDPVSLNPSLLILDSA